MMTILLRRKGINLSKLTVHKYMNTELNLKSVTRKPKYRYMKGNKPHKIFDNLLKQDFKAKQRNQKWCTDFTYLFLSNGAKRYNCTIIDLYDRRVIASITDHKITSDLAKRTLQDALDNTGHPEGVILHSDQGSQFTSKDFIEFCEKNNVRQSMSRAGYPYDNAPMERYFNTLKAEEINIHTYHTDEELNDRITTYAFGWYNNVRPHSHNGNIPPCKCA